MGAWAKRSSKATNNARKKTDKARGTATTGSELWWLYEYIHDTMPGNIYLNTLIIPVT